MRSNSWKLALAGAIAFAIGLLSAIRSAPAQQRSDIPERQRFDMQVRQDFFAGFAGNKEALARGMRACEDALAENPKNAEAMVWHGGGLLGEAAEAFQSGDPQKGMPLWTRGLREMQTAVNLEPDNLGVRIPRGATLLATSHYVPDPGMAKPLIQDGVEDYQRVYDIQKPYFDRIGTHPRGELLLGLADGYSRLGDEAKAKTYFDEILKDLPDTVYAKRADIWMQAKSLTPEQTRCSGCHVPK